MSVRLLSLFPGIVKVYPRQGTFDISRDLLHCFNLDRYAEADYKMFFRCIPVASIHCKNRVPRLWDR